MNAFILELYIEDIVVDQHINQQYAFFIKICSKGSAQFVCHGVSVAVRDNQLAGKRRLKCYQ